MSIAGVSSWTLTPAENIAVNGININEFCPAANVNNALRQIMSSVMQELVYQGADISASASISLAGIDYRQVAITGSASIIHAGTGRAGLVRVTKWNSPSTLVGSTLLLTDGGGNIVTATNDVTMFLSFGASTWRAVNFPVSGLPPALAGSVTSSASIGDSVFGLSGAGVAKRIPASVTASAGSIVVWGPGPKYPAGDGSLITNLPATGKQYHASYVANADLTNSIPLDDTPPLIGEGDQIISLAGVVTTTSTMVVRLDFSGIAAYQGTAIVAIFRGSTLVGTGMATNISGLSFITQSSLAISVLDSPSAAGTYTYTVRVGGNGSTIRFNGSLSARYFGSFATTDLFATPYEP